MPAIHIPTGKQVTTLPVGLHGDGANLYLAVRPGRTLPRAHGGARDHPGPSRGLSDLGRLSHVPQVESAGEALGHLVDDATERAYDRKP